MVKVDRSEKEDRILEESSAKKDVEGHTEALLDSLSLQADRYTEQPSCILETETRENEITAHLDYNGEVYSPSWSLEIDPEPEYIETINNESGEISFELPPGDYRVRANLEYKNRQDEEKAVASEWKELAI